jgi:uncharacterized damage-inducible protein DinB
MDTITSLAEAIERAIDGPVWHGPALREILNDITPSAAFARPIAGAHSVAELTLHLAAWAEIALDRLRGQSRISVPPHEDFPDPGSPSEAAWSAARARLDISYRELARHVRKLSADDLARNVVTLDGHTTAEIMLRGVVEHAAYHGGQMSLLKRASDALA